MDKIIEIDVSSEIGELEAVIMHTPGQEVENMTPENASKALYSDILNLDVAKREYSTFRGAIEKHAKVFELEDMLTDILTIEKVKEKVIDEIFQFEQVNENKDYLLSLEARELSRQLIQGVIMKKDNLTKFLDSQKYSLRPLHNFFFMRDASISMNNDVLIGRMRSDVRDRESRIMEAIFNYHPELKANTINPQRLTSKNEKITIEGGDVLVAREDILVIGTGLRTSTQGIDFILEQVKSSGKIKHIIVQELPDSPESFIHLDMVFTMLDKDKYMAYEPIILEPNKFRTVHIEVNDTEKVRINTVQNIPTILKKLGMDMQSVACGGKGDRWNQDREQWHSGANFFALAPGKVIGYERNIHTIEEMNKAGFEILAAEDIVSEKVNISDYDKYCITIQGAELSRGGGGARCMTMPIRRKAVDW